MDTESKQSNNLMSVCSHNFRRQCHQRYNLLEVSQERMTSTIQGLDTHVTLYNTNGDEVAKWHI